MDNQSATTRIASTHYSFFQSASSHLVLLLVLGIWLLGLEGGWLFGLDLGSLGLTDRDEGSNAEAAREMFESEDWISPTLNEEPRYAKPAFVYWLISGSYALFGINEFAARFPSALSGLCVLLLQYAFVYRWCGAPMAWLASFMLLLNMEFLAINRMVLTDPELVVFTTLAGYSFWQALHTERRRGWWFGTWYVAMGLAMLVKGPVGIIIPLLGVVPYVTLTRQWTRLWKTGFPLSGMLLVAVIAAPWYALMFQIHGDAYWEAAQMNTTGRFMDPMEGHGGTLLFYVPVLLVGFFPWSAFLPSMLYHSIAGWKWFWHNPESLTQEQHLTYFLSLWVLGLLLFFTLSATRLPHYIYPAFPAAAVLVALWWKQWLAGEDPAGMTTSSRLLLGIGYLTGLACMSAPAVFHWFIEDISKEFPAAVHLDLDWLPMVMGVVLIIGTMGLRQCLASSSLRYLGIWVAGLTIIIFAVLTVRVGLPEYQQYFVGPPQELAQIARYNLGADDQLIQVGRKRPSLIFYARHKIGFLRPDDEAWPQHLSASGRTLIILQTALRSELPEPVSGWTVILEHGGFSLLSSEPLL